MKRLFTGAILALLLMFLFVFPSRLKTGKAQPSTITVPDEFATIQEAINNASDGDTIFVRSGNYSECLVVNKTVTLLGENPETTLINGTVPGAPGVNVTADNVTLSGFTIRAYYLPSQTIPWPAPALVVTGSYVDVYNDTMCLSRYGAEVLGSYDVLSGNTVATCWASVLLQPAFNFWLYDNNLVGAPASYEGVSIYQCSNVTIEGNNISSYKIGIWVDYVSTGIRIFHNNLIDNTLDAEGGSNSTLVAWDDGYPSGGNYWSDYNGTDIFRGPTQQTDAIGPGSDGIGDQPFAPLAPGGGTDKYPLMKPFPWGPHDLGVAYMATMYHVTRYLYPLVFPPKTVVGLKFSLHLDVFVMNYGDYSENFNLTVYANTTVIGQFLNVALASKNSTILDLPWNTSGYALGNYTIRAYLEPVIGETDVGDNNYTRQVKVTIPGDINGDGKVDMRDIGYIAKRFNTDPSYTIWDPNADINDDGIIDMHDIGVAAKNFGQHYP